MLSDSLLYFREVVVRLNPIMSLLKPLVPSAWCVVVLLNNIIGVPRWHIDFPIESKVSIGCLLYISFFSYPSLKFDVYRVLPIYVD